MPLLGGDQDAVVASAKFVRDAYGGGTPCGQHLRERSILPPRYVLGEHDQVRLEPHQLLPDPGRDQPLHRAHVQVPGGDAELHVGHPARPRATDLARSWGSLSPYD